ncbi:hypothetical protein BH09DEP1_BH09DEP1_6640 [soil metagenome]
MKTLKRYALSVIGLSCNFALLPMKRSPTTFAHKAHAYYYNSSALIAMIQEEIETHKPEIKTFLAQLSTCEDLYCTLPIPHRLAAIAQVPAIFDLSRKKRNADLIEIVIARKIPLIVTAQNSRGLFHELAAIGKSKVMQLFLDLYKKYNRDPAELIEAQTNHLWTPLMVAATYGHRTCVKLLLENGARTYCLNTELESALHLAVHINPGRGKAKVNKVVELLCQAGIEVNLINENNLTAQSIACKNSLFEAAEIISKYSHQPDCAELRSRGIAQTYFALLPQEIVLSTLVFARHGSACVQIK